MKSSLLLIAAPILYVLLLFVPALLVKGGQVIGDPGADLLFQFVNQRDFGFSEMGRGSLPLWNPHIFSGIPAAGNIQLSLCYPPNLLFLILPLAAALNITVMLHLALGGVFMGAWMRSQRLSLLPSLAAGILYLGGGASYSKVLAGHETAVCLFAWAPLLFWSIDKVTCEARPGSALIGAFAASMMLLAGHPQYAFHFFCAAALYSAVRLAGTDRLLRKAMMLASIPVLASGVAAFQLAAAIQAKTGTMREGLLPYPYAASFSLPPENLFTLLGPYPWGGMGGNGYWGRWLLWEGELFLGITGLVMAILALNRKSDRDRWFLFGFSAFMILLALGSYTPLFHILYDHAPGFGYFRGHAKWGVTASFFLIPLAARGLQSFLSEPEKPRALPWILGGTGAVVGGAALFLAWRSRYELKAGWWHSYLQAIQQTTESYALTTDLLGKGAFLRDSLRGVAVALGIAAITFILLAGLIVIARYRPRATWPVVGLAIIELFLFDASYLATFPIAAARRPDIAAVLAQESGEYRVHVRKMPNSAMSTGASDIWGYDPFVPRRYAEFVAFSQDFPLDTPPVDIPVWRWDPLLELLRTRYFFTTTQEGKLEIEGPFPHLPRALLVPGYEVVTGPREALLGAMRAPAFNPYRLVVLEETPTFPSEGPQGESGRGTVRSRTVSTDELTLEVLAEGPSLLLLTDPFFPGWRADALPGSSQSSYRILRADYILQAIPLGAGIHRIRLRFAPPGLAIWGAVSLGTILLIVCAGLILWRRRRVTNFWPSST